MKILSLFYKSLIVLFLTGNLHSQIVPSDSGSFQFVGNRTITFVDSSRSSRNISSLVYYPAVSEGSNTPVLPGFRYPVISFGHGFTLNPNLYVSIFRHLASWGYVVIAPSTETGFFPSHINFARDLAFVIKDMKRRDKTPVDIFFNAIDTINTGVFGHSMGGGCSFLAGSLDTTIKAVSSLAAANTNPSSIEAALLIRKPVQLLSGQRDSIASYSTQQLPHYNNSQPFRFIANIKGGNHSQFHLQPGLDDLVDNPATITRLEQQRLTRRYVTAFFNIFLKSDTAYRNYLYGDFAKSDTGIIYQFNNSKIRILIQGFYNEFSDRMISDTVKIFLRTAMSPYNVTDTSISVIDSSGNGKFAFVNSAYHQPLYIQVLHRNSIETWSRSGGEEFGIPYFNYDFTTSADKSFGNNLILKGARYCVYNGDINSDGVIDGSDMQMIDNDSFFMLTGYLNTDVNGDGVIDGTDSSVADNNALNSISRIIP